MTSAPHATRILIVDDDEEDFIITRDYISHIEDHSIELHWSNSFDTALDRMVKRSYDIYFIDYKLGPNSGVELLNRAHEAGIEEPIILLTGMGNKQIDITAMQAGAVDYLAKSDLNSEKLERCIRYALQRSEYLKQIRESERKFRNIFEHSKDVVFLASETLQFTDINTAASTLLGFQQQELLGMNLYQLIRSEQDRVKIQHRLTEEREMRELECELITRNKTRKYCILSLTYCGKEKGDPYYQGIIHDITNIKKAEKETLQAEKFATTGRLVRTLGHEIRNPLTNIFLSIEGLEPSITSDEGRKYWQIIDRNSKRIGELVSQLLNSSRPEDIVMEKSDLQKIVEDTLTLAMDRIKLKAISTEINAAGETKWIMANPEKLKIAFLNIVTNAIEAMKPETGHLEIQITENVDDYKVSFSDNGTGIKEEDLPLIFEPYFSGKKNGMGFGLAATLNILQIHQANVDVESLQGHGTVFHINLKKWNNAGPGSQEKVLMNIKPEQQNGFG
jgi:PAS domain S-box-containing protein